MILEFILFVFVLLLCLILYARWNFGTLEKLGIPVVKRHFLLGSTAEFYKTVTHLQDYEWFKSHGNVFGVYEGRSPQVFICDPEMLRHVMVNDYEHFHSRRPFQTGDPVMNEALDFLPYGKWKAVRSAISPMFSSSRVKIMSKVINETVMDFKTGLNEDLDSSPGNIFKKFDFFDQIYNMFIDLTARAAFGLKIDNRKDPNNLLAKTLKEFMAPTHGGSSFLTSLTLSFPFIHGLSPIFDPTASNRFITVFEGLIEDRRKLQGQQQQDNDLLNQLIQLLDKTDTEEFKKNDVNKFTIMAQAVVFFMAGPDQFATSITFLAYFLERNPTAKRRLLEELDTFMEKYKGEILHENVNELVFTHACIQEVLRLVPPFNRPERVCTKDWEYNGLKLKKGTLVIIPLYAANRNPEYFEEAEEFRPERWLPENKNNMHKYAFLSFGHGPKNCIAMRYNYEVLYFTIAHLFSTYDFKIRDDTKVTFRPGSLLFTSFEPLHFDVTKRLK